MELPGFSSACQFIPSASTEVLDDIVCWVQGILSLSIPILSYYVFHVDWLVDVRFFATIRTFLVYNSIFLCSFPLLINENLFLLVRM